MESQVNPRPTVVLTLDGSKPEVDRLADDLANAFQAVIQNCTPEVSVSVSRGKGDWKGKRKVSGHKKPPKEPKHPGTSLHGEGYLDKRLVPSTRVDLGGHKEKHVLIPSTRDREAAAPAFHMHGDNNGLDQPWAAFENIQRNNQEALSCFIVNNKKFLGDVSSLPPPPEACVGGLAVHFRVVDTTSDVLDTQHRSDFMVICAGDELEATLASLSPLGSAKRTVAHLADGRGSRAVDPHTILLEGKKFWIEIVEDREFGF